MPRRQARAWFGLAKKPAWFVAGDQGWAGKMWGKRGKQSPVRDRGHQLNAYHYILNAYHYILNHVKEGAWVWSWKKKTATGE
jgi:hypothetical protein